MPDDVETLPTESVADRAKARGALARRLRLGMGLLSLVLVVGLRLHTLAEPLEADEAVYMILAQDWQDGGKPYVTYWENKPIGTFALYRVGIVLFGYNEMTPKILALLAVAASTILLGLILARERLLVAAVGLLAVWPALSVFVDCQANGANMEVFLCPFLLLAYELVQRGRSGGGEKYLAGAFVVLVLSLLIKQVTLPFLLIPFLFLPTAVWRRPGALLWRLAAAGAFVAVAHVVVYAVCGYSPAHLGRQLVQNAGYAASGEMLPVRLIKQSLLFPFDPAVRRLWPLVLAGYAGVGIAVFRRREADARVDLFFIVAVWLAIALPGVNFAHYYIVAMPILVLAFCRCQRLLATRRWASILLAVAAAAYLGELTWRTYLSRTPTEISLAKYGQGGWFLRDRLVGRQLAQAGVTGKRIYVDGSHPGVFFYSGNQPATRHFVIWSIAAGATTSAEIFADLTAAKPEVCVLMNPLPAASVAEPARATYFLAPGLESWLGQNYRLTGQVAGAHIFARRTAD